MGSDGPIVRRRAVHLPDRATGCARSGGRNRYFVEPLVRSHGASTRDGFGGDAGKGDGDATRWSGRATLALLVGGYSRPGRGLRGARGARAVGVPLFPETGHTVAGRSSTTGRRTAAWPSRATRSATRCRRSPTPTARPTPCNTSSAPSSSITPRTPAALRCAAQRCSASSVPARYARGRARPAGRRRPRRAASPKPATPWAAPSAPTGRATAGWPSRATRSPTSSPETSHARRQALHRAVFPARRVRAATRRTPARPTRCC